MIKLIKQQLNHSFDRTNLWIGLKSLLHALTAILITQSIPPHHWQVSFTAGLIYGSIMHFLFHYRDDQKRMKDPP